MHEDPTICPKNSDLWKRQNQFLYPTAYVPVNQGRPTSLQGMMLYTKEAPASYIYIGRVLNPRPLALIPFNAGRPNHSSQKLRLVGEVESIPLSYSPCSLQSGQSQINAGNDAPILNAPASMYVYICFSWLSYNHLTLQNLQLF
ncbi:unnamed protein product [Ilex paraguariensis]|uniref:Uncharacterized protein n=1 Tax=Ilex paraguariensis TaxID=185542 RepID=A0ABC8TF01_9AQUA